MYLLFGFQSLIPNDIPRCLLDDELARVLVQYFYEANQVIDQMANGHSKTIAQRAFFDTLGGYLKYYMVPISMYSYYAGLVKLKTVENVLELYDQTKAFLNTNGNGWRPPMIDFSNFDIRLEPLSIVLDTQEDTACIQLDMQDEHTADGNDMIVALPRLDPEEKGHLGNIWLPFTRKHTFNLKSVTSAFILLRYFEISTKCYNIQAICQDAFNRKFKEWIVENLEIHLKDDVFYPGLGGALRILETLRRKNNDFIVITKTDQKRHKTQNYKTLENRAKQLERHSEDWLKQIFGNTETVKLDDKIEGTSLQADSEDQRRMMYIYITIIVAAMLLIFVISVAYIIKWSGTGTEPDLEKPPKKEKRVSINENFGKRSSKDDEEVLLGPESSSIVSSSKISKPKKDIHPKDFKSPETSKSSCFPLCTRKNSLELDKPMDSVDSNSANELIPKGDAERPSYSKSVPKLGTVHEEKYVRTLKKTKRKIEEDETSEENIQFGKENL